jgi:hypothetical protein
MRCFVPRAPPEKNVAKVWQELAAAGHRAVHAVTYEHEGSKLTVTVGKERQEYRRKTGPRGGYIKNAGHVGWAVSTGSTVLLIVNTGTVLEAHSELPPRGWANPSLIGLSEITSIEYFEPPADGEAS